MPIITKITTQKKQKQRYNIFLDNGNGEEYGFSVNETILVRFHLRKGLELTKAEIQELLAEEQLNKGFLNAINYLSYRMRSVKEVKSYLLNKEIEESNISLIIKRLHEDNYLNDQEFARAFVQSRINLTLKGPILIRRELVEKGIQEQVINEALKLFSFEQQLEKASALLEKKQPRQRKTSQMEHDRKMYTVLRSNGHSSEIIEQVLQTKAVAKPELEEWNAILYQGEKLVKKYKDLTNWDNKRKLKQALFRRGFSHEIIDKFILHHEAELED